MDNQEKDKRLTIDKDSKIQVVVNRSAGSSNAVEINLARVFHRMKLKKRVFAWVLVLCLTVGLCAPLLLYQFTKPELTVSSVVTLKYEVLTPDEDDPENEDLAEMKPVTTLTAPDGKDLDLSQVTSAYVLQNALSGVTLSQPVSVSNLRTNIEVQRILSEDSRRMQEVASSMIADKNSNAYTQLQELELTYDNQFVVSLTNGFGEPDSRKKIHLTDEELGLLLEQVLGAYNSYLVSAYRGVSLPADEISFIDTQSMDLPESLDLLQTAAENLYDYCDGLPDAMKEYRSSRTGKTVEDWMETLQTLEDVNINYLYAHVLSGGISRDRDAMLRTYQYKLRTTRNELEETQQKTAETAALLENYKNDEILVSMQESEETRSTRANTNYYNKMVLEQVENFEQAAKLETGIADLENSLAVLTAAEASGDPADAQAELETAVAAAAAVYGGIREHMTELLGNAENTHYAEYTIAQGKSKSFLAASARNMVLGAVAGILIACVLWFMSALMPEFQLKKEDEAVKEAKRA